VWGMKGMRRRDVGDVSDIGDEGQMRGHDEMWRNASDSNQTLAYVTYITCITYITPAARLR
jgi:hypothetical protein